MKWEAGTLEAVGYKEGREVARHAVKTPGEVSALQISYFESGKPAAKNDLLIVYVSLVDKDGTLVFGENRREVTLRVRGGVIKGPDHVTAEAGIASFLVQTGEADKLTLKAESEGLGTQKTWTLGNSDMNAR